MVTGSLPHATSSRARTSTTADACAPRIDAEACGPGRCRADDNSDVDDRAGQCARDAVEVLHLGDHELAELIDIAGLGSDDRVVRSRDVLCQSHALDLGDRAGHVRGLADIGLDEDVCLDDHGCLLRVLGGRRWPWDVPGSTYR